MNMRKIANLGIELSGFGLGCMRVPMTKDENGKDIVDEKICGNNKCGKRSCCKYK